MRLLMYGAGSIGRGFIGPLFARAGYEVVFADNNAALVRLLSRAGGYSLRIMAEPPYDVRITGVRAVNSADEGAVMEQIVSCDIMAVSVGAAALPVIARPVANGIVKRFRQGRAQLDILLCENMGDAAGRMRGWLEACLPDAERPALDACGLVETAIGRMVPAAPVDADNPDSLNLTAEEYGFLPVDRDAFAGVIPDVPGMLAHSPFSFYKERKLYLHNMGHSLCAYLGMLKGYDTIAAAICDASVHLMVKSAMAESAAMLSTRYNLPFDEVFGHGEDLILRFANAALGDTCLRVGRDPLRKISAGERFSGALLACREGGIRAVYTALGPAAALLCMTEDAEQARGILLKNSGLPDDTIGLIMGLFAELRRGAGLNAAISAVQRIKAGYRTGLP